MVNENDPYEQCVDMGLKVNVFEYALKSIVIVERQMQDCQHSKHKQNLFYVTQLFENVP